MNFPLGDVLRAFVKGGWLRSLLDALKGAKITTPSGNTIELDQNQTVFPPGQSPFDSTPHKPSPPIQFPGRRP